MCPPAILFPLTGSALCQRPVPKISTKGLCEKPMQKIYPKDLWEKNQNRVNQQVNQEAA